MEVGMDCQFERGRIIRRGCCAGGNCWVDGLGAAPRATMHLSACANKKKLRGSTGHTKLSDWYLGTCVL